MSIVIEGVQQNFSPFSRVFEFLADGYGRIILFGGGEWTGTGKYHQLILSDRFADMHLLKYLHSPTEEEREEW